MSSPMCGIGRRWAVFKRACDCEERRKPDPADRNWFVYARRCNHSAFSGYRYTPSDYSGVSCRTCGSRWRTKAKYVDDLPDGEFGKVNAHGTG